MWIRNWFHRRRVMLAADRFPLPPEAGLELEHIVEQAERLTGRLTMIAPVPMDPRGPSGRVDRMLIDGEALDLVQVPEDADEAHQEHIALHEIAHLVLGHVEVPASAPEDSGHPVLAAIYGQDVLAKALETEGSFLRGCVACDPAQEQEAEAFARRLAGRIALARRPHAVADAGQAAQELAERVDRAFGIE
jgi:hypothetical protein